MPSDHGEPAGASDNPLGLLSLLTRAFGQLAETVAPEDRWVVGMLQRILPLLVLGLVKAGQSLRTGDAVRVERAIQALLQPVGTTLWEAAWSLQGLDHPLDQAPPCPHCACRMRLT